MLLAFNIRKNNCDLFVYTLITNVIIDFGHIHGDSRLTVLLIRSSQKTKGFFK